MISKTELVPGDSFIRLRAYMTDHPEVYGSATTLISVDRGPLIAAIDKGLSSKRIPVSSRYIVSGAASYDTATNDNAGLSYSWECEAGPDDLFEVTFECPEAAQRSGDVSAFNLPASVLQETLQQGIQAIRYRL